MFPSRILLDDINTVACSSGVGGAAGDAESSGVARGRPGMGVAMLGLEALERGAEWGRDAQVGGTTPADPGSGAGTALLNPGAESKM